MSQLGRISGPLLEANLVRNGVDLAFRNHPASEDLLYLDVNNNRIGVNKTPISNRFEVDSVIHSTNVIATTQANIANIQISSNNIGTFVPSNITIRPAQSNPIVAMTNLRAGDLDFKNNTLSNYATNGSIQLDPNGTGIVDIQSSAKVNGNLTVTGNFNINGDLSQAQNIIIGDTPLDTVVIAPDFKQSIIPGDTLAYDLGTPTKRWRTVYSHQNNNINNLTYNDITVGNQMFIESSQPRISTIQSNDDLRLLPDTELTQIERYTIISDTITNLDETVGTLASTGIGYVRFVGNNGVVIPAGTEAEKADFSPAPEVGATRWNTTTESLECFDGTVWNIATGPGGSIGVTQMEDLGNIYTLILG